MPTGFASTFAARHLVGAHAVQYMSCAHMVVDLERQTSPNSDLICFLQMDGTDMNKRHVVTDLKGLSGNPPPPHPSLRPPIDAAAGAEA